MTEAHIFAMELPMPGQDKETSARPLMEAQAMELRRRFALREEPSDLKPGDLCVEKEGLERTGPHMRGATMFVLIRFLDLETRRDRMLMEATLESSTPGEPDADCMVGYLDSDGDFCGRLYKASLLRRWQEGTEKP